MYAIIKTGGKQYKVKAGDTVKVEKLAVENGSSYTFEEVLALNTGDDLKIGTPTVIGATVTATVVDQNKSKKVIVYKFKKKKGFHKKKGHRQPYTELKIDAING